MKTGKPENSGKHEDRRILKRWKKSYARRMKGQKTGRMTGQAAGRKNAWLHRGLWQMAGDVGIYLFLDGAVSFLFYRSPAAFCILLPGLFFFHRRMKSRREHRRRQLLTQQFLSALQLLGVSLNAGYVPENAFRDALRELRGMYPPDAPILVLFQELVTGMDLNRPLDVLLMEAGNESGVEEIRSFAEVFYTVKRIGGDMIRVVRNTTDALLRREETLHEMEAVMAGKQMEQRMMSVIPLFILGYVSLTSPGFLDVCYHNPAGTIIMSICLVIYIIAYLWSARIMEIQV